MCRDVDLAGLTLTQPPLGDKFNGIFNGNGKTISNFRLAAGGSMVMGFARVIGRSGMVRDLTFIDANVEGVAMVGIVAGLSGGKLKNVNATGRVTGSLGLSGGLIGVSLAAASFEQVSFDGTVYGMGRPYSNQLIGVRE